MSSCPVCKVWNSFHPFEHSAPFLPPSEEKVKWPHMSQSVTSMLSGGWCMRAEMASAETADHTRTHRCTQTQDWWMTQVFGLELGLTAREQMNSFRGQRRTTCSCNSSMFLLLAVLSLIIKPILVSSICFVKRHFSSSSLKLEKKSSFWVELFMWLNNAMCPYKWEHHWLSCLLICLYWKPDLCQQSKHELLIQFKSSVAPPGLAVIPWGFFFFLKEPLRSDFVFTNAIISFLSPVENNYLSRN